MLATIAELDGWLRDHADDYAAALKTSVLGAVTEAVERICGRVFEAATYIEWYQSPGGKDLLLKQSPLIGIYGVWGGTTEYLRVRYTPTTAVSASVNIAGTNLALVVDGAPTGGGSDAIDVATSASMAALGLEIDGVTVLGTWAATVLAEGKPSHLLPAAYGSAYNADVDLLGPEELLDEAQVDADTGILTRYGWPSRVMVQYQAGYAVIPSDLMILACRMAGDLLATDPAASSAITEERIEDYAYKLDSKALGIAMRYLDELKPWMRRA